VRSNEWTELQTRTDLRSYRPSATRARSPVISSGRRWPA